MGVLKQKRFWKTVTKEDRGSGFAILLDGREIKTPLKSTLLVPSIGLAEKIIEEWLAVDKDINPSEMPFTRYANSTIDKVNLNRQAICDHLCEYAVTDLICYRSETPQALYDRQAFAWNPLLEWFAITTGIKLNTGKGIIFVPQSGNVEQTLSELIIRLNDCELTGFYEYVTLTGSFVLAYALFLEHMTLDEIWQLSRIDENWQIEQWGEDEENKESVKLKYEDLVLAHDFIDLIRVDDE